MILPTQIPDTLTQLTSHYEADIFIDRFLKSMDKACSKKLKLKLYLVHLLKKMCM